MRESFSKIKLDRELRAYTQEESWTKAVQLPIKDHQRRPIRPKPISHLILRQRSVSFRRVHKHTHIRHRGYTHRHANSASVTTAGYLDYYTLGKGAKFRRADSNVDCVFKENVAYVYEKQAALKRKGAFFQRVPAIASRGNKACISAGDECWENKSRLICKNEKRRSK